MDVVEKTEWKPLWKVEMSASNKVLEIKSFFSSRHQEDRHGGEGGVSGHQDVAGDVRL